MCIVFSDFQIQLLSNHDKVNANVVASNFYQDCYCLEKYHMSYEQYMDRLSDVNLKDKTRGFLNLDSINF